LEGGLKSGKGLEVTKNRMEEQTAICCSTEWLLKRRGAYCPLFFWSSMRHQTSILKFQVAT